MVFFKIQVKTHPAVRGLVGGFRTEFVQGTIGH
jgi:hypothetical protein